MALCLRLLGKTLFPAFLLILSAAPNPVRGAAVQKAITGIERFTDLGAVDPAKQITVSVQVARHNQAGFDAAVDALYTPGSPTFHQWMTDADLAKYAPTASEVAIVQAELQRHGLTVIDVTPFSIRVRGSAANVERAFQTSLHELSYQGKQFRANVTDARLTGLAGALVESVTGLEAHMLRPKIKYAVGNKSGKPRALIPMSQVRASGGLGGIITEDCFTKPLTYSLTSLGAPLPTAKYYGNIYTTSPVCGFMPAQLQSHYGLLPAYQQGLNGNGQNIVLFELLGYADMQTDANVFSTLTGLPALTSKNFKVLYPEGPPNPGTQSVVDVSDEIALDIQWAHAIAPQAKIVVVATSGVDDEDFFATMQYIGKYRLGNSVSVSYEFENESFAGPAIMDNYNQLFKVMAAEGISVNMASGDDGDDANYPYYGLPPSLEVPGDSPYATTVGGTSLLRSFNGHAIETGWGTNIAYLDYRVTSPGTLQAGLYDPPPAVFAGGAGGGESTHFAKPAWQGALPGTGRLVPDISALADPNTGVPIILTPLGGTQSLAVIGGTSLATPIFSAFWAIANQAAGKPLGQAAPLIASLPEGAVTDILRFHNSTNATGTIVDASGSTYYPAATLIGLPESAEGTFLSALLQYDEFSSEAEFAGHDAISFGTDSSLTVGPGWDNVTGFGVPNGLTFIKAAAGIP